jgi:ethanolamine phosphate phosphodiesterase
VGKWNKKYGEDYWLREYTRFGDIFFDPWLAAAGPPGPWQRGRKMVASLPGNHDLGFGSEVKIPVRDRFSTYFGDVNRVDIVGNHTIVSVDTVSLSADSTDEVGRVDLQHIYLPSELFLREVKSLKRKAVEKELRFWRGQVEEVQFPHRIEDLHTADFSDVPRLDPGEGAADFPTILLTHVPLYRNPGTPCGPMREHWPPTKPPKGQTDPVVPDDRNAISVSRGYQYQNVLSEEDSVKLIKEVGNVIHVFSGDDHDYCEVVHSDSKNKVREITVKSMSMAMGVPTPGFLMVSLYNPIGPDGEPLPGSPEKTLQTHLCLLPNQVSTYTTYCFFALASLTVLIIRAFLVPTLHLQPFALDSERGSVLLPMFKDKIEDKDSSRRTHGSSSSGSSASRYVSARFGSASRTRSTSINTDGKESYQISIATKSKHKQTKGPGKWGWGEPRTPRIEIDNEDFYDGGKSRTASFHWKAAASRSRGAVSRLGYEMWATTWRVAWMTVLFWAYLAYKG